MATDGTQATAAPARGGPFHHTGSPRRPLHRPAMVSDRSTTTAKPAIDAPSRPSTSAAARSYCARSVTSMCLETAQVAHEPMTLPAACLAASDPLLVA